MRTLLVLVICAACSTTPRRGGGTVMTKTLPELERSCAAGVWSACNELARRVTATDRPRAVELYTASCRAADGAGCFRLGELVGASDPARSRTLREQACDLRQPAIEEEKRWYQAVGLPLPRTPIQRLSDLLTALAHQAASLPPSLLVQRTALRDARVERIAIATLAASDRGIAMIGAAMDAGGFVVVHDDRDVPLQRWRIGRVVVRRGRVPWCEEHGFSYVESRAGRGFRISNTVLLRDTVQLVSCP